jgi:hypothetical protein
MELDLEGQHTEGGYPLPATQRNRAERLQTIGRMASPNWYCRTGTGLS